MDEQALRPVPKPCPECGGERIRTRTVPPMGLAAEPPRLFEPISSIFALTCTSCGHTSLYAAQPEKLVKKSAS